MNTVTLDPRTDLVIQKPNFNKQARVGCIIGWFVGGWLVLGFDVIRIRL